MRLRSSAFVASIVSSNGATCLGKKKDASFLLRSRINVESRIKSATSSPASTSHLIMIYRLLRKGKKIKKMVRYSLNKGRKTVRLHRPITILQRMSIIMGSHSFKDVASITMQRVDTVSTITMPASTHLATLTIRTALVSMATSAAQTATTSSLTTRRKITPIIRATQATIKTQILAATTRMACTRIQQAFSLDVVVVADSAPTPNCYRRGEPTVSRPCHHHPRGQAALWISKAWASSTPTLTSTNFVTIRTIDGRDDLYL